MYINLKLKVIFVGNIQSIHLLIECDGEGKLVGAEAEQKRRIMDITKQGEILQLILAVKVQVKVEC